MTSYIWDKQQRTFVPRGEYKASVPANPKRSDLPCPQYMPDTPEYTSPLYDPAYEKPHTVTSRSQRREEMKKFGVREVDPSEKDNFLGDNRINKGEL